MGQTSFIPISGSFQRGRQNSGDRVPDQSQGSKSGGSKRLRVGTPERKMSQLLK